MESWGRKEGVGVNRRNLKEATTTQTISPVTCAHSHTPTESHHKQNLFVVRFRCLHTHLFHQTCCLDPFRVPRPDERHLVGLEVPLGMLEGTPPLS